MNSRLILPFIVLFLFTGCSLINKDKIDITLEERFEKARSEWRKGRKSIDLAKKGFIPSPRFLRSISLAQRLGISHSQAFKS